MGGRWWWSRPTQPKVPRSKICPNLHFRGGVGGKGEGWCPDQLNPKCQDLSKSAFWGGGRKRGGMVSRPTQPKVPRSVQICIFWGGGVVQTNSSQSSKICPNLHFPRGEGGWSRPTKPKVPRSVQIWGGGGGGPDQLNLHLGGGVVQTKVPRSVKICMGGGGGVGGGPDQLNPKCQDLSKSAFGGWGGPDQLNPKCQDLSKSGGDRGPDQLNPKCQDLSKSAFEGGVVQTNSTQSAKICPNLYFQGGGVVVQTNSTQSAKICQNLHGGGGGGEWSRPTELKVSRSVQICIWGAGWSRPTQPKVPRSVQIWGGSWSRPTQPKVPRSVQICIGGGVVQTNSTQSAKICLNLYFRGWGWGRWVVVQTNSTQSAKICQNLHLGGGGEWSRPTELKVSRSVQICILGGGEAGGGGGSESGGTLRFLSQKFWQREGVVVQRVGTLSDF